MGKFKDFCEDGEGGGSAAPSTVLADMGKPTGGNPPKKKPVVVPEDKDGSFRAIFGDLAKEMFQNPRKIKK